jgi:dimethylaniline monooxygenase (N-oxide forming)
MVARSVAVIGAGPSGLTTAKELLQEGHAVTCFERSRGIGGIFRFDPDPCSISVWDTCRLTSSTFVTSFSDFFPGPDHEPFEHRHMAHDEYLAYLERYADHFDVRSHVVFGREVVSVSPTPPGWRVVVRDPVEGCPEDHTFDAVAICTGVHSVPNMPDIPGLDSFPGQILHTAHYKGVHSIKGRSAVFVGAGESGADIIAEAARRLDHCHLSLRRGAFVIPRYIDGYPNDYTGTRVLYSLPEFAARRSDDEARRRKRRVTVPIIPLVGAARTARSVATLLRRACGGVRETDAIDPRTAELIGDLRERSGGTQFESFATKTEAFVEAIADGRCELRPEISEIDGDCVRFTDGSSTRVEAIVFCTGFSVPDVPFFRPPVDFGSLYRSCFDIRYGGTLAFIGFVRPSLGAIPPIAEMQARVFARVTSDRLKLPPQDVMKAEQRDVICRRRRYYRSVFARLPYLVDFSVYMDTLAEMVGCKPHLTKIWRDWRLLERVYTGPFASAQYRLSGPHASPARARKALLHAPRHRRAVLFAGLVVFAELARLARLRSFQPELTLVGRLDRRQSLVH